MNRDKEVLEGILDWKFKFWDDDPNDHWEVGSDNLDNTLPRFDGKKVRITIEIIDE